MFSTARKPYRRQWLTTLSLCLGAVTNGASRGWASPYIAKLTAPDSTHPLKLTFAEASWIASLIAVGRLLGAVLGAILQDFIGRKKTLLCMSGPLAVGWGLIIIAPSVYWLYASRILTGLAVGMMYSASASFLGEIADRKIRGSLIICHNNAMSVGSLMATIMGGLLPMEDFSYVLIVLTGFFFVTFVFVADSPYYHLANGDIQKTEESLKWFNKDADVKRETQELQEFLASTDVSLVKRLKEFKKPEHRKSLIIILCIHVFLYGAGMNTTNSYAEVILRKSQVDIRPSDVVMGLSSSALVAGLVALVLVDKLGRRALLVSSGLGLGLGHILLGFHFHMLSTGIDPTSISWLPIFSLFLVYFSIPVGLGSVKDTLLGELFPPILKTPASFAFTASSGVMSFAVTKSFQPYLDLVGEKYVFWTFAASALSSVVFTYFCVPETTRISLIDIQANLKRDNNQIVIGAENVKANVRDNV